MSLNMPVSIEHVRSLEVEYSTKGPGFYFKYKSGKGFPYWFAYISWADWDGLVAWVEQQRADEARQKKE